MKLKASTLNFWCVNLLNKTQSTSFVKATTVFQLNSLNWEATLRLEMSFWIESIFCPTICGMSSCHAKKKAWRKEKDLWKVDGFTLRCKTCALMSLLWLRMSSSDSVELYLLSQVMSSTKMLMLLDYATASQKSLFLTYRLIARTIPTVHFWTRCLVKS